MRTRWMIAAAALLAVFFPAWASPASATEPGPLDPGSYVTDISDVLTSEQEAAIDARLREVAESTGVELFVVLVPSFSSPSTDTAWVAESARLNGLADHQYLIAIATGARMFAINGHTALLSDSDQAKVTNAVLPSLRDDDWAGALHAAADEIHYLRVEAPARNAQVWTIVGIVVVAAAALIVALVLIRRARRQAARRAAREAELQDLGQQASIALVRTDDLVRTSEQELEFARAQFGDDSIGEFVTALAVARENLNEAFTLKQQLDDEIPDSEQEREQWNTRILELCSTSTDTLEERKADFDELRKLEQRAPEALEAVRARRAAAGAEVERAEQILSGLTAAYATSAISAVADNPAQARTRIALTDESLAAAASAIAQGRTGDAALAIRAAEAAVQQATRLEDAVEALADDLGEAEKQSGALVVDVQESLTQAQALVDADGQVAAAIGQTQTQLAQAQALLGAAGRDPVEALRLLDAANTHIDQVVARVRDEQAKIAHARNLLDGALRRADTQIGAAEGFIANRRGAIDSRARTRLSEAVASRGQAVQLAETDPVRALTLAQRADALASEALRQAQYDVSSWGGRNDDSLGAFLSGVFIGQSTGGGHRGGYSSGGSLFSGGGSSRSSSSGGSVRVGGFGGGRSSGGGGSRSSRSGGRF